MNYNVANFKQGDILKLTEGSAFYPIGTKVMFYGVYSGNAKKGEVRYIGESYEGSDVDVVPLNLMKHIICK